MQNTRNFSQRLETARQMAGLSKGQMAERCGVSLSTVSRWYADSVPHNSTLEKIASVLGVFSVWLKTGTGPMMGDQAPAVMDEGHGYIPRDISPGPAPPSGLSAADLSNHIDLLIAELRPLFQALPTATIPFRAVIRSRINARIDEYMACACS